MLKHHPSPELLSAAAVGRLSPGVHKIILAHAALCSECRALLDEREVIGGAMLDDDEGITLTPGALERTLGRIGIEHADDTTAPVPEWLNAVPEPVREIAVEVARKAADVRANGAPTLGMLQAVAANREVMELVRIEPGKSIPAHAHDGSEYTLVLTGGFRDQRGVFEPGDLAVSDAHHVHRPVAEPGEPCIALIVTTAALRFKGPLGLLQRLMTLGRS